SPSRQYGRAVYFTSHSYLNDSLIPKRRLRTVCLTEYDMIIGPVGVGESLQESGEDNGRHARQLKALRAVALVEFVKGLLVLLAGFGVLSLMHRDAWDMAESFLEWLHVSPESHYAQVFLNLADQVTDGKLWAVAAGAMAYSLLRFVEAYGLWM